MDLGPRLAVGNTAEVYALGNDRVVKLFNPGVPREVADREVENARAAATAGLPVPTVYERRAVDGRPGIVFEQIPGPTMLEQLGARPGTLLRNARRLARLHRQVHAVQPSGLRSVRERLRRDVRDASGIDAAARDRVLAVLASLPDGAALCHGDFHPGNVLVADPSAVIDWLDAGQGPPAADVARTTLLLGLSGGPADRRESARRERLRRWYLRYYRRQSPVDSETLRSWELVVAVARLTEDVPEAARLRSFIRCRLLER